MASSSLKRLPEPSAVRAQGASVDAESLLQPRAFAARLQRADPRVCRGRIAAGARAGAIPRDPGAEPRRVLPDPSLGTARAARHASQAPHPTARAREQLDAIRARARELVARQTHIFEKRVRPQLHSSGIRITDWTNLKKAERDELREGFDVKVFPVLTPLSVDPAHPFHTSRISRSTWWCRPRSQKGPAIRARQGAAAAAALPETAWRAATRAAHR